MSTNTELHIEEIAHAIADPGMFLPRLPDEPISIWSARALSVVIEKAFAGKDAENERLSSIIENLNFALATQAAELSMKNGHLAHAKEIYSEAVRERDELRQWKGSMMQVESEWDRQKIARLLNLPLGLSFCASLQRAIERMLEDRKADQAEAVRLIKEIEELKKSSASDRKERQEYAEMLIAANLKLEAIKALLE